MTSVFTILINYSVILLYLKYCFHFLILEIEYNKQTMNNVLQKPKVRIKTKFKCLSFQFWNPQKTYNFRETSSNQNDRF